MANTITLLIYERFKNLCETIGAESAITAIMDYCTEVIEEARVYKDTMRQIAEGRKINNLLVNDGVKVPPSVNESSDFVAEKKTIAETAIDFLRESGQKKTGAEIRNGLKKKGVNASRSTIYNGLKHRSATIGDLIHKNGYWYLAAWVTVEMDKPPIHSGRKGSGRRGKPPKVRQLTSEIIRSLEGEFDKNELARRMAAAGAAIRVDPSYLTNVLKRMEEDGELILVNKGQGNLPTIYRRGKMKE